MSKYFIHCVVRRSIKVRTRTDKEIVIQPEYCTNPEDFLGLLQAGMGVLAVDYRDLAGIPPARFPSQIEDVVSCGLFPQHITNFTSVDRPNVLVSGI